jgi:hypothetical protein
MWLIVRVFLIVEFFLIIQFTFCPSLSEAYLYTLLSIVETFSH